MEEIFNEADKLLKKQKELFSQLNSQFDEKRQEYMELVNKQRLIETELANKYEEKEQLEKAIKADWGDWELYDVLQSCKNYNCEYRHKFEKIRNRNVERVEGLVSKSKFHFFMCFRGNYYINPLTSQSQTVTVVNSCNQLIDKTGYVWWGKFFRKRIEGDDYETLEPFGESLDVNQHNFVASKIRENVRERITNGEDVYLYNYSPNPDLGELYKCSLQDFWFGHDEVPEPDERSYANPECSKIPEYYFVNQKKGNCQMCKKREPGKCELRFDINFWFKINKIIKVSDPVSEFNKLISCYTNDNINLAIPILYPLLVYQKVESSTPAQILRKKKFTSIFIITDKQATVNSIRYWLKTNELKVDQYIVKDQHDKRFHQSIKGKKYLGDIVVHEYAHTGHLLGHVEQSVENKYKELLRGPNVSSIINQLSAWIID